MITLFVNLQLIMNMNSFGNRSAFEGIEKRAELTFRACVSFQYFSIFLNTKLL